MKNYTVKKHRSNYPNPLTLVKGQSVIVGEVYKGTENWEDWIFCTTNKDIKISGKISMSRLKMRTLIRCAS